MLQHSWFYSLAWTSVCLADNDCLQIMEIVHNGTNPRFTSWNLQKRAQHLVTDPEICRKWLKAWFQIPEFVENSSTPGYRFRNLQQMAKHLKSIQEFLNIWFSNLQLKRFRKLQQMVKHLKSNQEFLSLLVPNLRLKHHSRQTAEPKQPGFKPRKEAALFQHICTTVETIPWDSQSTATVQATTLTACKRNCYVLLQHQNDVATQVNFVVSDHTILLWSIRTSMGLDNKNSVG